MANKKRIVLGGDHNGVEHKEFIKKHLITKGYDCIDVGPSKENGKVDYVDYAYQVGKMVNDGQADMGILICGTGQGCAIVANKFRYVRAALVHNKKSAPLSRDHNNTNILCLGSWILEDKDLTLDIVDIWLNTPFGEGRHTPRVEKISKFDYS